MKGIAPAHQMDYRISRERMVKHQILDRGIKDEKVVQAMREVPIYLLTWMVCP
ncbi:MAG: hypothetical protein HY788_14765 [Deltaproteobacteria bacterium]|nr:hypothetical protein [Deltaproteobacteria bacterium]